MLRIHGTARHHHRLAATVHECCHGVAVGERAGVLINKHPTMNQDATGAGRDDLRLLAEIYAYVALASMWNLLAGYAAHLARLRGAA